MNRELPCNMGVTGLTVRLQPDAGPDAAMVFTKGLVSTSAADPPPRYGTK